MAKYEVISEKHKFYFNWLQSMSLEERKSIIGQWVIGRTQIFRDILLSIEKSIEIKNSPVGNYQPKVIWH